MSSHASQWVDKQDFRDPHVVILGLGDGDHVIEWLKRNPDSEATIVESRADLISAFEKKHARFKNRFDIVAVQSGKEILSHPLMRIVAKSFPPILCYEPSYGAQRPIFEEAFRLLTGRNIDGLRYYLNEFGFGTDAEIDLSENGRLLTVKDLGFVIDTAHGGHPRAAAIRVLRELVI